MRPSKVVERIHISIIIAHHFCFASIFFQFAYRKHRLKPRFSAFFVCICSGIKRSFGFYCRRGAVSGKKKQRIIIDKKFFIELLYKCFCSKSMQCFSRNSRSKAVAGKDTVLYFKDIRIRGMTGNRKTFHGKPRNRKGTIPPQYPPLLMNERLIRRINLRIIYF